MIVRTLIVFATLFLVSCAKDSNKSNSTTTSTTSTTTSDSGNSTLIHSGYIARCLQSVRVGASGNLWHDVKCSPILTAGSADAVSDALRRWAEANCPRVVTVERSNGSTTTCEAQRPQARVSSNTREISRNANDCRDEDNRFYLTPNCNY